MKLKEIAARIDAHLKRIERDLRLNPSQKYDRERGWVDDPSGDGLRRYFNAWAMRTGNRISVVYVSYQGASTLTKAEALRYLEWLDAGNIGKHFSVKGKV